MSYWQDRQAQAQANLTNKSIRQTEKQLKKYYASMMEKTIADFEATYNKVMAAVEEGREPTPADLYKLDKYWQSQAQLKAELQKLGDRQIALLSKEFELNWFEIYYSIAIPGSDAFNTIDNSLVQQMINSIWVADGKSWSQRIWENTERLAAELNEGLIHCVATGKKTTELKNILQERFGVSYNRADALVRTEMAHIQTEAAKKRYEDAGVLEVEVWAPKDERQCEVCGELHTKRFPANGPMPIPAHPRCRCCVLPVI
jgi:SPP1 gp7 family putative phage head morphogenesis protein